VYNINGGDKMNIKTKDYQTVLSYVQSGKSKTTRKIANNTYATINQNKIDILYHNNRIVEIYPDRVILHDAGYRTYTTKERLNWFVPRGCVVYQNNFQWYLSCNWDNAPYVYQDGITIYYNDCRVENAGKDDTKERQKLIKQINTYVDNYMIKLVAGKIPAPNNGDCWGCLFVDKETGKTVMGNDHLLQHMKEKYYVPSLLNRAVEIFPVSPLVGGLIGNWWYAKDKENRNIPDSWKDIVINQGKSSLKRYMLRELGIA
jgi:hypothetical protein